MNYIELIEVAQHFEKEVSSETLVSLADLEKRVQQHKELLKQANIRPALKNALLDTTDDLQVAIQNISCEKNTLNKGLFSCLLALHEVSQSALLHQTIDLYGEVKIVIDKLRVARGLQLIIDGCIQPVRRETQQFKAISAE